MLGVAGRNQVALLGKVPCQGDFVRWNAADGVSQAFHRWLEESHEAVRRANTRLSSEPTCFVFTMPGGRQALVGTLATSTDKVGRVFPLAVYVAVDAGGAAEQFPSIPDGFRAFFAAGARLLADAATLSASELESRVEALSAVSSADAMGASAQRRRLEAGPAVPLVERLQGEGAAPGVAYYAFNTFLKACQAERGKEPTKPGVTLECPFPESLGPFCWAELARRQLGWRSMPPAMFWHLGSSPRLLLSIGTPGVALLMHLAKPEYSSMKVWPLLTRQQSAIDSAQKALTLARRQALEDPTTTVESLLAAFGS
ncbi:type VI secretion system-associated protein TagF [Myxococcus sp. K15C18031901]|uniref:type VI secretion system-associated protein TagF n=1 Tax=Myxococcus dinghuensis TaxID=2906761 RepID=UPI0020A704B7|nr:type VI secretion system-associated protein TagF [Myxococcus dinghuensis]MCP3098210.1 type VI secretion system-associated protein TagF [Myxococcus dinghuensis]